MGRGGGCCLYAKEANAIFGRHLNDVHFSCRSEQFLRERGDSFLRLMRSEWRGVAQGQIQFPRNALPEMMVMEK